MEIDESYVPVDVPTDAKSYIRTLLIDADDDDDARLHEASLSGDKILLGSILEEENSTQWIELRVRPFMCSPLRLAVTGESVPCVEVLVENGAEVDSVDIKGQTPLFVATSIRNIAIMKVLLNAGANPEGSPLNRGTPLLIAVRDGFAEGVQLLLQYGSNPEPFDQLLNTCVPGWPLHHAIVYAHFSCFLQLLRHGAAPNLTDRHKLASAMLKRLSIPHAILKYAKEYPEFASLYHASGGNLRQRDSKDSSIAELNEKDSMFLNLIKHLTATPHSLKSICRVEVRKILDRRISESLPFLSIPSTLKEYLDFREYDKYTIRTKENTHCRMFHVEQE